MSKVTAAGTLVQFSTETILQLNKAVLHIYVITPPGRLNLIYNNRARELGYYHYPNSYFTYRIKIAVNSCKFPSAAERYLILIHN